MAGPEDQSSADRLGSIPAPLFRLAFGQNRIMCRKGKAEERVAKLVDSPLMGACIGRAESRGALLQLP